MARLPYITQEGSPELVELIDKIKAGRGGLLNVYRMLLHSPGVTQAWMGLIDAIRSTAILDGRAREIAIIRVANINNSAYEKRQHVPRHALANGLTLEDCQSIADWPESGGLTKRDNAILHYTDAVTRDVHVSDKVFDLLRPHFTPREIVELTVIIGIYNMHCRVIEPLEIDVEP